MKLLEPKPKKYCRLKPLLPLPIIKKNNGEIHKFKGKFVHFSVLIEDENEMKQIVSNGYFGKANFSRSFPLFTPNKYQAEIVRKRQFDRRNKWGKQFGDKKLNKKCIVVPDSDEEADEYFVDLKPIYETDCSGLKESVYLLLEEAFFLNNFVKCMEIVKEDEHLSSERCWELFKKSDKNFIANYIVYHFYRSKNWVVKPGIKFGGDYLLYKQGPPFYHASYLVIIDIVNQELKKIESMSRRNMDMIHLQCLSRLCETASKELIICKVIWPPDLKEVKIGDLHKFEIEETLIQRWLPSIERQLEDE